MLKLYVVKNNTLKKLLLNNLFNMNNLPLNNTQKINRKEAIKKIGNLSKYAALTSLGTFFILSPLRAQTASPEIDSGGVGF